MQIVPGHVYDEIDRLVESGKFDMAYEAVDRAVNQYFDKTPAARFHCLWLFYKGAMVAERAGRPQVALAYLQRFIVDAETLLNEGPRRKEVALSYAQIRPARLDEIADAKARLPEVEKCTFDILKKNLPGKSDDQIRTEVEKCKTALTSAQKSGPCFIATAAYGTSFEPEVGVLREFRDQVLVCTVVGRWMARLYAQFSPPLARRVHASGISGALVRVLLRPVIFVLRFTPRARVDD